MTGADTDAAPNINIPGFIALVADQVGEAVERFQSTGKSPSLFLNELQLQIAFTAEESATRGGKLELKPYFFSVGGEAKKDDREAIVHTVTLNLVVPAKPTEPPDSRSENESSTGQASVDRARVAVAYMFQQYPGTIPAPPPEWLHALPLEPSVQTPHGLPVGGVDTFLPKMVSGEIELEYVLPTDQIREGVNLLMEEAHESLAQGAFEEAVLQYAAVDTILTGHATQGIQGGQQRGDQGQSQEDAQGEPSA